MSDQTIGKREEEVEALVAFLDARDAHTSDHLDLAGPGPDPPDLICTRPNGEVVGVELTMIMRPRCGQPWHGIRDTIATERWMDPYDAAEMMCHRAQDKAEKIRRSDPDWLAKTILVMQLMESSARELHEWGIVYDDFTGLGFAEIWAADWTQLDAFSDVELLGLHPAEVHGYYANDWRGKPYG